MNQIKKATITNISSPNMFSIIRSILIPFGLFNGHFSTIEFICGDCKQKVTVQHDNDKDYHRCPVCRSLNEL